MVVPREGELQTLPREGLGRLLPVLHHVVAEEERLPGEVLQQSVVHERDRPLVILARGPEHRREPRHRGAFDPAPGDRAARRLVLGVPAGVDTDDPVARHRLRQVAERGGVARERLRVAEVGVEVREFGGRDVRHGDGQVALVAVGVRVRDVVVSGDDEDRDSGGLEGCQANRERLVARAGAVLGQVAGDHDEVDAAGADLVEDRGEDGLALEEHLGVFGQVALEGRARVAKRPVVEVGV